MQITDRETERHEGGVVIGFAQRRVGEGPDSITLVVTGVPMLTKPRRLKIGRRLFELAGGDMDLWDKTPEGHRVSWTQTHMGRYPWTEVSRYAQGGARKADYTTPTASGGGYPSEDIVVQAVTEL